jgi:hypothetical protein
MNPTRSRQQNDPETAVDDVRRVREQIAAEHRGDLRAHREETIRIAAEYREKLGLRPVQPPPREEGIAG